MMQISGPLRARWQGMLWAVFATLLLLPAVAMRFTAEVRWTAQDFLAAALLLGSIGLAARVIVRRVHAHRLRGALLVAVASAGVLVWLQGAVGIF